MSCSEKEKPSEIFDIFNLIGFAVEHTFTVIVWFD